MGERIAVIELDKRITVSAREMKVLKVLADYYGSECPYLYTRTVAKKSGLNKKQARRSVRSLARKGLAEYMRGLFDDEGMLIGSGYGCTPKGQDFIAAIANKKGGET